MFERFGREARGAVVAAQQLARTAGSSAIDTRHLLIAVLDGSETASATLRTTGVDVDDLVAVLHRDLRSGGLDAAALASLGIDLAAVRDRADAVFGDGALDRSTRPARKGHIPFSADAKKSLELALREALRLRAGVIDARHLALGLLRATGSPAETALRRALANASSDVAALRALLERPVAQAS